MAVIYVLESKYHGSNLQLHGLARAFPGENRIIPLQCGLRSRKKCWYLFYPLCLAIKRRLGCQSTLSLMLMRLVLNDRVVLENDSILIAKTAPCEMPAAFLSAGNSSRIVLVGQPRRLSRRYFWRVISTPSCPAQNADIFIETMPVSFTYEQFRAFREQRTETAKTWCVLLGGDARGYKYTSAMWSQLADALFYYARRQNVRLVITSSPRTGCEAEQIFKKKVEACPELVHDFTCWNDGPRKGTFELMGGSDVVVVTEDSAAMVSEALNTRLPVVVLAPSSDCYNSMTTGLVRYHSERGSLLRLSISDFAEKGISEWIAASWNPLVECWSSVFRRQV